MTFLATLRSEVTAFAAAPGWPRLVREQFFAIHTETLLAVIDEIGRLRAELESADEFIHDQHGVGRVAYPRRWLASDVLAMSDEGLAKIVEDVIREHEADDSDAHYDLVMPFTVVRSAGGPFDDDAYCAGFEAGVIDVKLMALSAFGQSATDLLCVEANWPQVSLILMKHGWNVDESSMSIADGWVSVKVVGF